MFRARLNVACFGGRDILEKDFGPTILARFSGIMAEQFTIRMVIGFDSLCQLAMILHKISAL